jgi:hypothetical protein
MNRYPAPPTDSQGQTLSSVNDNPPPNISSHMPSPQTVPSYIKKKVGIKPIL